MPELLAVTDLIADVAIIFASISVSAFAFSYATFFNWRLTQAGRSVMYFVLSLLSVALLSFLGRWLGPEYYGREVLRPLTWIAVFVTAFRLTWVLWTSRALNLESRSNSRSNPMTDPLVPTAVKTAAKRAFIRTMFQGYESVLAIGLSANVVISLVRGEVDVLTLGVTAAVTVLAPPLAGLRSWLNITRNGIPKDYADVTLVKQAIADQNAAVSRVLRRDLKNKEA